MNPPSDPDDAQFAAALREALIQASTSDTLLTAQAETAPPDHLLDLIVRTAARAVPSPEGALLLVDPQRRVLTFEVVIGQTAAAVKHLTVPLGHGIAGLVAVSGQPLAVANAQQDPRHARDVAEQTGYFPNTILAVPVTLPDGSVVGVLELLDRQGAPTFSLDDMDLAGRFAQLAAAALEQRRAFAVRAVLVGQVMTALTGLSEETGQGALLQARLVEFVAKVEADPIAQRSVAMAETVAAIARRGEAETRACAAVLDAFAAYLAATPAPGAGLDALR